MATAVEFFTGVDEPLAYVCRLLRKASRGQHKLVVCGAAADLARLDALLWTFDPGEFIAHARWRRDALPAAGMALTPVWLADDAGDAELRRQAGADAVLVNLGPDALVDPAPWARVIEIVGADAQAAVNGRERWRAVQEAGLTPVHVPQRAA